MSKVKRATEALTSSAVPLDTLTRDIRAAIRSMLNASAWFPLTPVKVDHYAWVGEALPRVRDLAAEPASGETYIEHCGTYVRTDTECHRCGKMVWGGSADVVVLRNVAGGSD